jgi:hypothetical protein
MSIQFHNTVNLFDGTFATISDQRERRADAY